MFDHSQEDLDKEAAGLKDSMVSLIDHWVESKTRTIVKTLARVHHAEMAGRFVEELRHYCVGEDESSTHPSGREIDYRYRCETCSLMRRGEEKGVMFEGNSRENDQGTH